AGTTVTTYALSVSAQGVDSGLDNNGNNIYLYNIAGSVVGSTSGSDKPSAEHKAIIVFLYQLAQSLILKK
ncbi:hypothetical protein MXD98_16785, partial [Legionella pneumophila]